MIDVVAHKVLGPVVDQLDPCPAARQTEYCRPRRSSESGYTSQEFCVVTLSNVEAGIDVVVADNVGRVVGVSAACSFARLRIKRRLDLVLGASQMSTSLRALAS